MKLNELSATELINKIDNCEVSLKEVIDDCLDVVHKRESKLKAWEYINEAIIYENVVRLEEKQKRKALGKLKGIPVGIKDVFNTKDMPTTMGSEIWSGFTPGNDARVVHNIRENDGLIFGKTVTAEFAVHYLSAGKTVNPHDPGRIPGTSSSGSAVAVATYMVPLALGTQTAGSIVRPSSYCGIYGFKPTFGVVPRTGALKTTDTLDSIGCMARSVDDIMLLFDIIRVKGMDYPFVNEKLRSQDLNPQSRLRIGYIVDGIGVFDGFQKYTFDAFRKYLDKLSNIHNVELINLNSIHELNQIHTIHSQIYDKTLAYYFKNEFNNYHELSDIMKRAIENGQRISFEEYKNALDIQAKLGIEIEDKLKKIDILMTISTAGEAPLMNEAEPPDTSLIWSFLGMPSLTMPKFKGPTGLPFGLLVLSKRYDDLRLLSISKSILDIA
jgi:Asp-tRNA(Asn)/Glu-tRNA(Gln) amidotransferase A subunit family amidase